ncbi:MAG: efflux RND transporter periplasmic adaptor subunit [Xanthomonadales bacterium]|nr:efflux RND transporter periplasmic adaptor subunit [Xanthomonadales bacterium]
MTAALILAACSGTDPAPAPPRPAVVGQAQPAAASADIVYSGEIRARHESQLAFRVGGKIERRLLDVGARTLPGDVLAVLDGTDLELQLAAARAAVASARADADLARAEFERADALLARNLVSRSQHEAGQTAQAAAQARLAQAQAQLRAAGNQVDYTQLRADRAGVLSHIQAETGQVVAAGQIIAVLAQDDELEVEFALPESQLARYRVGMPGRISLWADDSRGYQGQIREIAPDAQAGSRTYRARVTLTDADAAVQLGMTARVAFAADDNGERLAVPLTAIHGRDLTPAVWRIDPDSGQVHLQPVQVAAWREHEAEIAGGLSASDWLVLIGAQQLHEGQVIRPVDAGNRPLDLSGQ